MGQDLLRAGADDLADPVAVAADRVEGEVGGALVDGADDAGTGVAETADELFTGEGVGEHAHVQTVGETTG